MRWTAEWGFIDSDAMDEERDIVQKIKGMLREHYEDILAERETDTVTKEMVTTAYHRLMHWKLNANPNRPRDPEPVSSPVHQGVQGGLMFRLWQALKQPSNTGQSPPQTG